MSLAEVLISSLLLVSSSSAALGVWSRATAIWQQSNQLEEHVLRAPHKSSTFTQFKRDISVVEGVLEFSRGKFYFVSDCLDVERLVEKILGKLSPVSCTSGYVHSDQLSYTLTEDENE